MADTDPDGSDLLQRAKQAQAQSKALREQVAGVSLSRTDDHASVGLAVAVLR